MSFLIDLVRWFWQGKGAKNDTALQPVSQPEFESIEIKAEIPQPKKDLDLMPRLTSQDVMNDLQSLQSLTQQFDHARKELIAELQRLAPPKKRNPFWNKDAA